MDNSPCNACIFEEPSPTASTGASQHNAGKLQKKARNRNDRGKKGASCMWINTQIINTSQQSIDALLQITTTHLDHMNLVNLTTAIHRLGKIVAHDPKKQASLKELPHLSDLLAALSKLLASTNAQDIQPQSISNILWALASIRHVDKKVILLTSEHVLPNMSRFKPFELATLLWALAKLTTLDCENPLHVKLMKPIFDAAVKFILEHISGMEFRSLSMVAWACATAKQANYGLFNKLAEQMKLGADVASCQEMANTVWAFGTVSIENSALFIKLVEKSLPDLHQFKAQELSNMLWGFASCGFFHERFYKEAAAVAKTKELSAQHLANILWAFSRVRPKHALTQRTCLSLLPLCCQKIRFFKAQEICSVALSVAKAFARDRDEQKVDTQQLANTSPSATPPSATPPEVIEFFRSVPKGMPRDMRDFSTQSLTNIANAFATLGCDPEGIFPVFGQEAIHRAPAMEPAELLRIFQVYLAAPAQKGSYSSVAGLLAMHLADRLNGLRAKEIRSLSRTCIEFLDLKRHKELNREELHDCCIRVATASVGSSESAKLKVEIGKSLSLEVLSAAGTEEPCSTTPEISDNNEEGAESSGNASDTEQRSKSWREPIMQETMPLNSMKASRTLPCAKIVPVPCFSLQPPSHLQTASAVPQMSQNYPTHVVMPADWAWWAPQWQSPWLNPCSLRPLGANNFGTAMTEASVPSCPQASPALADEDEFAGGYVTDDGF